MGHLQRKNSFHDVDEAQASGILADVFRESDVYLGGSSVGKGLKKAARYYLEDRFAGAPKPAHLLLPGAADLNPDVDKMPLEEAFYVIDLGVVVSQVYQWRKNFPRVEPFYAVKCNPDPVIIKTLAVLGCNFDCASRNEIKLVEEVTRDLPCKPDIIYANPCKARAHLLEAVCKGVRLVTFDNATEVIKCAAVSKKIELILRIITDDRGSQCRLSSKFGAPRTKWRPLLAAAQKNGLQVVGVSFHVGSGCRDASRYEMALKDAREIFDIAEKDFGMKMRILDIGGGFPGETHSMWNPAVEIDDDEADPDEGKEEIASKEDEVVEEDRFMFFNEIAAQVAPVIDQLFPPEDGVRVIGEPGRYLVAACATLCCSVVSARSNEVDNSFMPEAIDDMEAAQGLNDMSRLETENIVHKRGPSMSMQGLDDDVMNTISEELNDYSKLFASQQLAQQEVDVYADSLDLYHEGFQAATDLLGPPDEDQMKRMHHTVEGMSYPLVAASGYFGGEEQEPSAILTLAAAGEAAVNGMVLQAVADSTPLQDDYAYYINDGVYGAFNNIMFDHAHVRPRVLRTDDKEKITSSDHDGFQKLSSFGDNSTDSDSEHRPRLYASTVFGPTCDSIDVIARSVLLPKLAVGDWMYFQNMGAYTMAASSSFNGFTPSEKLYVSSVPPDFFEALIKGPPVFEEEEEKKADC